MGAMCGFPVIPSSIPPSAPFYPRNNWRCDYCKSKTPSHYEKCPNCGAPKPEAKEIKSGND